jgi:hypothetical protein
MACAIVKPAGGADTPSMMSMIAVAIDAVQLFDRVRIMKVS